MTTEAESSQAMDATEAQATNAVGNVVPDSSSKLNELWSKFLEIDWENVIVAGIENLAWPFVALLIAWWFKAELIVLMRRLKNLKGQFLAAEFDDLKKASEQIDEDIQEFKSHDVGDLLTIARIRPTAAVVEAWRAVEAAMINLLPDPKFDTKQGRRQISGSR